MMLSFQRTFNLGLLALISITNPYCIQVEIWSILKGRKVAFIKIDWQD